MEAELRLLLVAEDPLARAGLARLLAELPGCVLVGQTNSADATAVAAEEAADLLVWDLGWETAVDDDLPPFDDLPLPTLALLADEDQAAAVWTTGARALLRRDAGVEKLRAGVTAVAAGLYVLDPALVGAFQPAAPPDADTDDGPAPALTPREGEVLRLLAEGLTNKAIAQRLEISDHTVKFHVNAILGKLNAQSRTDAVVRATRRGWLSL
jgi:two-component system, NarL family, nitrate/nitrite response regulator NarL